MIITLENNEVIQGSELVEACFRSSLEPVPVTFEARIKLNEKYAPYLLEGKVLKVGKFQTPVIIVLAEDKVLPKHNGSVRIVRKVIALHENSAGLAKALKNAVIREKVSLSEIYRSCGGKSAVIKDFVIPKFYMYKGMLPSEGVAKSCQEHGGVVQWIPEGNKLSFVRIHDLFSQKVKDNVAQLFDITLKSDEIVKREIPQYVSIDKSGAIISSSASDDVRNVIFSPNKTSAQLNAMTNVLLNAKKVSCDFSPDQNAGDLVQVGGVKMVIITAAHYHGENISGVLTNNSIFWLGVKSR